MSDDKLLKKIEEIIASNNKVLLDEVDKRIEKRIIDNNAVLLDAMDRKTQASEERITKKLSQKIEDAQVDTIDSLSDLINEGYRLHEVRIQRIEAKLDLPPLKQN